MKNILTLFVLIFSLSLTVQSNTQDHEKPPITYDVSIDDCIVQFQEVNSNIATVKDCEGLNIYYAESGGHFASIETTGYSESITFNSGVIGNTNAYKKQSCNSLITSSWQRDTSRMYLRRTEGSGQDLQRNYHDTAGSYRAKKRDHYHFAEPNELFSEAILLDRNRCGIAYRSIFYS